MLGDRSITATFELRRASPVSYSAPFVKLKSTCCSLGLHHSSSRTSLKQEHSTKQSLVIWKGLVTECNSSQAVRSLYDRRLQQYVLMHSAQREGEIHPDSFCFLLLNCSIASVPPPSSWYWQGQTVLLLIFFLMAGSSGSYS